MMNLQRYRVDGATGCHVWLGARDRKGYGIVGTTAGGARKNYKAHRVAYERALGAIAPGLTLDHLCGNVGCINPVHLEPVTASENMRRRWAK